MEKTAGVPDHTIQDLVVTTLRGIAVGLVIMFVVYVAVIFSLDRQGTYTHSSTVADLNGDGIQDVIIFHLRHESELTKWAAPVIWLSQGGDRFNPLQLEWQPTMSHDIQPADVDGDGDLDLYDLGNGPMRIYLNQGGAQGGENGVFELSSAAGNPEWFGWESSLLLGDLDNDGDLDSLVVPCCNHPGLPWVWIIERAPGGGFTRQVIRLSELDGYEMPAAALGDLDGDGSLDVFAAVSRSPESDGVGHPDMVLFNDGTGHFRDSGQRLKNSNSCAVALGDLDGDGDLDAVVGTERGAEVWINQGGSQAGPPGSFLWNGQEIEYPQSCQVFLADFDGDGVLDALLAGKRNAAVWRNDGQGTFSRSDSSFRYSQRHGLAAADFNGDGYPDVFAAAYTEAQRLWLNDGSGRFRE